MKRNENSYNIKKLSISGIMLALVTVFLLLANILSTSRIALYALCSFIVSVIVIEYGIKAGWAFYFASCILSLIIVPEKLELAVYIIFFGIYAIVKYYIEKLNNIALEYILKYVFFNGVLILLFIMVKYIFTLILDVKFPWAVIVLALEAAFLVYDYVYTLFIQYYRTKLKTILKI